MPTHLRLGHLDSDGDWDIITMDWETRTPQANQQVEKLKDGSDPVPSLTIENYVKTIHELCARQAGGPPAATGQIASVLRVSPGTVTSMLKTLSESGMVEYTPYEGVRLTSAGRVLARRVLRRHRLIELFLVQTLKFSWDEVHEEAEHMEHAVSDLLIDRIDAFLGYPTADPHGDPIPQADGSLPTSDCLPLFQCPPGTPFRLMRVLDQEPPFLRYLDEIGLPLGAEGQVAENRAEMGLLTIDTQDRHIALARESAEKLLVLPLGGDND